MANEIREEADKALRDFNTVGVPSSGRHSPEKSALRGVFAIVNEKVEGQSERLATAEDRIASLDETAESLQGDIATETAARQAADNALSDRVDAASEGYVVQKTYINGLRENVGTREGQPGRVIGPDAGVHTDPVSGEVVPNTGEYIWSTSPAGWLRVGDVKWPLGTLAVRDKLQPGDAAPASVLPSNLTARDWSNIYPDPDMVDASLYVSENSSITSQTQQIGAVPATRISSRYIAVEQSTEAKAIFTPAFPIEAGKPYYLSAKAGRWTGVGGATTRVTIHWYSDFSAETLISSQQIGSASTSTSPVQRSATVVAPTNAVRAKLSAQKDADAGTRLILFDVIVRRAITEELLEVTDQPYVPPSIQAVSALSIQIPFFPGVPPTIVFEKDADAHIAPASLTKIISAMVAIDTANQFEHDLSYELQMQAGDETIGSGNNISIGDTFSLHDAIANMLLPSSNVTATVVARTFGQLLLNDEGSPEGNAVTRFISEINAKAAAIGMVSSHFNNPHGLPVGGQTTTSRDMSLLLFEAMNYPAILSVWGQAEYEMQITGANARTQQIASSVSMISDSDILGGKTGTITPNTYSLVLYSSAPNGNRLLTVVLQSPDDSSRYSDARTILNAVKSGYEWPLVTPQPKG